MFSSHSKVLARVLVAAGMASVTGLATAVPVTVATPLAMSATLVSACEVSGTPAIAFGNITSLLSSGDKTADTGSTFQVACSSDMAPTIDSLTTRSMKDLAATPNLLPFNLSLANLGANDFPTAATALTLVKDGTLKTVRIYAKIAKESFTGSNALPGGTYTNNMTVNVNY